MASCTPKYTTLAAGMRSAPQHSLEVDVPCTGCQVSKGAVQRTADVGGELHVRRDPGVPSVIHELQAEGGRHLVAVALATEYDEPLLLFNNNLRTY